MPVSPQILSDIVYPISAIKLFGPLRLIQTATETLPTNASIATLANDTSKLKNWDTYPLASSESTRLSSGPMKELRKIAQIADQWNLGSVTVLCRSMDTWRKLRIR